MIVYLYTAEIYPTKLRGLGLALTATMARIGGFIAPFISGSPSIRKGIVIQFYLALEGIKSKRRRIKIA